MTKQVSVSRPACTRVTLSLSIALVLLSGSRVQAISQRDSASDAKPPAATKEIPSRSATHDEYLLGPDDQVTINVMFAEELTNRLVRIDSSGYINIPFVGRIRAADLTVHQLQVALASKLSPYFENPSVTVNITEYGSKPVSVLGEVHKPSVLQLRGAKTLIEMLSAAGGLTPQAGSKLTITRERRWGALPLRNAHVDASGEFSIGDVDLTSLLSGNPTENILVRPDDTITVPRAKLIYVMGEVHRPGGFPLHDTESASALQMIALAEGPLQTAKTDRARILRLQPNGQRQEIEVNLSKVLDRRDPDVPLKPDDILYVPNSKSKRAAMRIMETAIQMGTGVVIWGVRP